MVFWPHGTEIAEAGRGAGRGCVAPRLGGGPDITVPAITLESDANGAPHPQPSAYAKKFTAKYSHRTITGGIGHNLPQEAPQAFAEAILDVARG
jgi:pimeloyl-ACP methyl ester carboxylesterase